LTNLLANYKCSLDIVVDTNAEFLDLAGFDVTVCPHPTLSHPFHLTWMHRRHFKDNIERYHNFMYVEDDMMVLWEAYQNYLENFKLLWPHHVPSFIRIEEAGGVQYVTDVTRPQAVAPLQFGDRLFTELLEPYHALWIMPQTELQETMPADFVRVHESREQAASYPMWGLGKTPLVQIEKEDGAYRIVERCHAYHLPNNYATSAGSQFGKLTPDQIFLP
jgi:hypothetical protein